MDFVIYVILNILGIFLIVLGTASLTVYYTNDSIFSSQFMKSFKNCGIVFLLSGLTVMYVILVQLYLELLI